MPVLKLHKVTRVDPELNELNKIRDEWTSASRELEASALLGACTVPGCRTMPFVTLKTNTGRRPLCLRHFERLRVETV